MRAYDILLSRLDAFIRKYYANQLLRGGLVLLGSLLSILLIAGVGEYFLYLPPVVKVPLISLIGLFAVLALVFWIARPLLKMARMGNTLRREDAAVIAGRHFPEVGDKMLNVLQLKAGAVSGNDSDLLLASIEQKSQQLSVIPITRAIDLSRNRRYLPWVLPLLLLFIGLALFAPNPFRSASERLLQPTKAFERPAPFQFVLLNENALTVVEGGDVEIVAKATGDALPPEMEMVVGNETRALQPKAGTFTGRFEKVTSDIAFRLSASGYQSKPYVIRVLPRPLLLAFRMHLNYPDYTGKKDETRNALGDLTLPAGTQVTWMLSTQNADAAQFQVGTGPLVNLPQQGKYFSGAYRFLRDTFAAFQIQNRRSGIADRQMFRVRVIPDAAPTIQMNAFQDTTTGSQVVLTGSAGDDYGISRLLFQAVVTGNGGTVLARRTIPLPLQGRAATGFQYYFDAASLVPGAGQRLRYWVEVWDNDAINGSKVARSSEGYFDRTGGKKVDSFLAKNAQQVAQGLSSSSKESQKLQQETKELQSQLLQTEETSWESKEAIQQMMDRQEEIKTQLEATKKRFEEGLKQRENREMSEDAKEKADALKEQMDRLLNKELQDQMKKLQELMQRLNKDRAVQTLQKLEQDNKLFNMDMQRLQELMKQLEQQLKLEDLAGKVDKLAEKQQDLKNKTQEGERSAEELDKEQKQLQKDLQQTLNKEFKEASQQATKQQQQEIDKSSQEGKKASDAMQQSSEQLGQNQKQKASQAQEQAKQKLQEMAQALRNAAQGSSLEQINIDIRATRQILTNLVRLSFAEEALSGNVKQTPASSPAYLQNQSEQARLYQASHIIRDSLYTLSKRIFQLGPTVNKETAGLESALSSASSALSNRMTGEAAKHQQYAMTHTNNLALMLNELLSNLIQQQQQQQSQGGGGACMKPGGSKPSGKPGGQSGSGQLQDVISGQQQLGNAMQQAAQSAARKAGGQKPGGEGGQKPGGEKGEGAEGGQKPGGKSGSGGTGEGGGGSNGNGQGSEGPNGEAEQLARLAEQQAAIRRQVQQLMSKFTGSGNPEIARMLREIAQKMDRTEEDLVNRRITPELAMRQSEITTRLLEADKALREQEQDNKRSSTAGVDVAKPIPAELQRILQQHKALLEGYRTIPADLKPTYRQIVERYYQSVGNRN